MAFAQSFAALQCDRLLCSSWLSRFSAVSLDETDSGVPSLEDVL
jgi:hypothetical protein